MTNIGAIKVTEKKGKNPLEYLVFVADSMANYREKGFKVDDTQKLYRVKDLLLMGSGFKEYSDAVANELAKRDFSSAREAAENVQDITSKFNFERNSVQAFILGGKDGDSLNLYHLRFMRGPKGPMKQSAYSGRNHAFDGSGSKFVEDYLTGTYDAGKPLYANDLAEGLALVFDFGKKGAKDVGVNDKLQFGIISPNGVSRLYPPGMDFSNGGYLEYVKELTGIKLPNYDPKMPLAQKEALIESANNLGTVFSSVYLALTRDLSRLSIASNYFTSTAEHWGKGMVSLKELKNRKLDVQEAKSNVGKGAKALIQRGLQPLIAYKRDFDKRLNEIEEKVLKYES